MANITLHGVALGLEGDLVGAFFTEYGQVEEVESLRIKWHYNRGYNSAGNNVS